MFEICQKKFLIYALNILHRFVHSSYCILYPRLERCHQMVRTLHSLGTFKSLLGNSGHYSSLYSLNHLYPAYYMHTYYARVHLFASLPESNQGLLIHCTNCRSRVLMRCTLCLLALQVSFQELHQRADISF